MREFFQLDFSLCILFFCNGKRKRDAEETVEEAIDAWDVDMDGSMLYVSQALLFFIRLSSTKRSITRRRANIV